jgi:hypothetical protein
MTSTHFLCLPSIRQTYEPADVVVQHLQQHCSKLRLLSVTNSTTLLCIGKQLLDWLCRSNDGTSLLAAGSRPVTGQRGLAHQPVPETDASRTERLHRIRPRLATESCRREPVITAVSALDFVMQQLDTARMGQRDSP